MVDIQTRAHEVEYGDCRSLCQFFKYSPNECSKCQYSDFRFGLGIRAHAACIKKGISRETCLDQLAKAKNPALKSALNKKNRVSHKKISIVDSHKTTDIVAETIDIPLSGIYEDEMPSIPGKCTCPETERVPAGASFGFDGEKHHIKGWLCPRQGCMISDKLQLPPRPITTTYEFKLMDLNPPPQYSRGHGRHRRRVHTESMTHTGSPSITVFFSDSSLRRYESGTPLMLSTKNGLGVESDSVQLVHFVAKKRSRTRHRYHWKIRTQPPVALFKADGKGGIIRSGDIVCLSINCQHCERKRTRRGARRTICVPTKKYVVAF
ncbi:hypothetical protein PCE1_004521 [Barthelona sp. PCE]